LVSKSNRNEVVAIAGQAVRVSVSFIAITDSQLSPSAKSVEVLFMIPEDEYTLLCSLAASLCLVQTLATATAAKLHPKKAKDLRIPSVTEIAGDKSACFALSAQSRTEEMSTPRLDFKARYIWRQ
jgi:DNA-binding MurR/RpiR family transcriptional regulator